MSKFIKVSFQEQNETVVYFGQLLNKNQHNLKISTKFGEMNFPVKEVQIDSSNEEEFEKSTGPVKEQQEIVVEDKGDKKRPRAIALYKQLMVENGGEHPIRGDVIKLFISQIGLTEKGAATYQQDIKTKIKNGKL